MSGEWCSPEEWVELVDWIRARWSSRWWADPTPRGDERLPSRAELLYEDFRGLPPRAIRQVLEEWRDAGNEHAPKPAKLRSLALAAAQNLIPEGVDPTDPAYCGHVWELTADPAMPLFRDGRCIRCGKTESRLAREFPTVGEVAEAAEARRRGDSDEPAADPEGVWV